MPTLELGLAPGLKAVRRRVRSGAQRFGGSWWQILQCGLGAGIAWVAAQHLWGQAYPVFACVAVVVCLGISSNQRLRRVGELGVGVTLGVLMGSVVVLVIGRGPVQIAVIVVVAMALARFLDGGNLIVNQSALQAVFIVAYPPTQGGGSGRWLDAMTGVVVALVIAALLPPDPRRELRGRGLSYSGQLADLLEDAAVAVRRHDAAAAASVLTRARTTQETLDKWAATVTEAQEVHRISPLRRSGRDELARSREMQAGLDRATRNVRVALRRISTALDYEEQLPSSLAESFDWLAAAIRSVGVPAYEGETEPPSVTALKDLAATLGPRTLGAESLSATVVVAQLRSTVVDLLVAQGVSPAEAHRLLPR